VPPVYVFDVNETLLDLRALDATSGVPSATQEPTRPGSSSSSSPRW